MSFDGFRRSYIERGIVKTLEKMAKCGATAEVSVVLLQYMYPSFPSRTIPNHYAIATGLYPESNGIVDNVVYESSFSDQLRDVRRARDVRYFNGQPVS
ncbi:unnamed protein product [Gongylonema pulchrum]|uniref:Acyloxyacyl hydrolase n=1 Tax=Gongylonema pulchrum TaxID=637853 RepID=A0A183CWS5_9BILA|nr:unnamed protein product [Gongylonema pulchrum]